MREIKRGWELIKILAATGSGAARLAAGRAVLTRNPQASATEVAAPMLEENGYDAWKGFKHKVRSVLMTGEPQPMEAPPAEPTIEELIEAVEAGRADPGLLKREVAAGEASSFAQQLAAMKPEEMGELLAKLKEAERIQSGYERDLGTLKADPVKMTADQIAAKEAAEAEADAEAARLLAVEEAARASGNGQGETSPGPSTPAGAAEGQGATSPGPGAPVGQTGKPGPGKPKAK